MLYRYLLPLIIVVASGAVVLAQDKDLKIEVSPTTNPWTNLKLNNAPENFQFIIVTDRTGGHRAGVFEDAMRKINLLQPEFVMSVGDLIEGYTHDAPTIDQMWNGFQSFTAMLKMPFFYVPGNHDMATPTELKKWKERFGRDYYHFVYRDVLFLCLNTEDGSHVGIGKEQRDYVRKALDENKNVRWTLVFMHRPLWTTDSAKTADDHNDQYGWAEVESMLREGNRQFTAFAGHMHNYTAYTRHDRNFITLATTGAGSALRGTSFGEFDHVMWVTMTDEGPVLANLLLNGIWDRDVVTESSREIVSKLASSVHVAAKPLQPTGAAFTGGTIPLKITNDADIPVSIVAHFRPHDSLLPDPFAIDKTIQPNSVEVIDLKIQVKDASLGASDFPPLVLDSVLTYVPERLPKLQINRTTPVAVDQTRPIARAATPIVIDGKLDEWKDFPNICTTPMQLVGDDSSWTGPGDASFKFATSYDEQFVYIAIDSTDENVLPLDSKDRRNFEDGIEVRLDARPEKARAASMGKRDDNSKFLMLSGSPGNSAEDMFFRQDSLKTLPKGTKFVCLKTPNGFSTEIAIPVSYLNDEQPGGWKDFRLNITQNDHDDIEGPHVQLNWRPGWRTDETFAGSGTFRKE